MDLRVGSQKGLLLDRLLVFDGTSSYPMRKLPPSFPFLILLTSISIMARKKFTDKQLRFINEYVVDCNATQAAIRAGYSQKTSYAIGQENLTKPEIKEAIAKKMEELSKKTEITKEYLVDVLHTVIKKSSQAEPVMKGGEPTGEYKYDSSGVVKAVGELNKMLGFNEPEKVEFRDKTKLETLGVDELEDEIANLEKELNVKRSTRDREEAEGTEN